MCKRPVFAKISQPNFVTVAPQSFEGTLLIILVSKQVSNPSLDQHPRSVLKSFPIIEAEASHSMVEASHDMVEASQIAVEASHHPCW